jgi:hypothetical protein
MRRFLIVALVAALSVSPIFAEQGSMMQSAKGCRMDGRAFLIFSDPVGNRMYTENKYG